MSKTIANPYENFIALSRYARWISEDNRRETWGETVDRYFGFMLNHLKENYNYIPDEKLVAELKNGVFERNVMPSMRSVMTSGVALERDNVAGYNCAFLPVDSPRSFDETMYILMCGTGVGFSVEYKYINKLPAVPETFEKSTTVIVVEDSKQGWAKAYRELLALLWSGQIPAIDVSKVRPAGARLKTMGGRSSGPQPLVNLFDFTIAKLKLTQSETPVSKTQLKELEDTMLTADVRQARKQSTAIIDYQENLMMLCMVIGVSGMKVINQKGLFQTT